DIVNQLNWGRTLIESPDDMLRLAELNLRAGKKAKASTAYQPALRYFTMGTEILPEGSWDSHHTLTFALYLKRCECESLTTHFDEAEALLTHMLSHTASSLEQAEIYTIGIAQYTMISRHEEALEMGRDALKLFDIELPGHDVQTAAQREFEDVRFNLGERDIADLIDLPMMTDPEQQESIKLLMYLVPPSYVKLKNLALFTFITARAINITIKFGNTREMPFVYGIYGVILRTLFGEYDMGDEFGKLGIRLSEKLNDTAQKCRAVYIAANYLNHWRMPVASSVPLARQAFRYALESGELQMAGYTFNAILRTLTLKGEELGTLRQQVERAQQFATKTKNDYLRDLCTPWQQFIRNLQGRTHNTRTLNDRSFVEQQFLNGVGKVSATGGSFYTLKLQTLYLYDHYADALSLLTEAEQSFVSTICNLSVVDQNFYASLTFSALYPLTDVATQGTYREQLSARQQQMQRWAEDCPENFLHKYLLVEAEIARIEGRHWDALTFYRKAIEAARHHEFLRDDALANELLAKFWLAQGDEKLAGLYMIEAHYGYQLWGASGKVNDLEEKYPQLFVNRSEKARNRDSRVTTIHHTTETGNASGTALDFATVMKASHAISGEIVLDTLLTKLMTIVIENAGAQRGLLLLPHNGQWRIEAERDMHRQEPRILQSLPIAELHGSSESPLLSKAIVHYVIRTREALVLNNVCQQGNFMQDPYVQTHRPKSVLCLPLLNQGRLNGILYVENNLTPDAFSSGRVEVLTLLASQTAIALENARLYTTLEQQV
ncbi:MAG: GAF domain-containing protein, partial [bacterium]|nr:GAF domain-containing protein [bacterium]